MSLQHEILFQRLAPRYERVFGEAPPVDGMPVDKAVRVIRERLAMQAADWQQECTRYGRPDYRSGG